MIVTRKPRNLLLVAAREPRPGMTKTRLGASIGMNAAATLYGSFLIDLGHELVPAINEGAMYQFGWAYTPGEMDFRSMINRFDPRFGHEEVLFVPQVGDGWAERQHNLLLWGHHQGFERTILISSDSPHVRRRTLEMAFHALEHADFVFGRVHDGGYYLIGNRGFHDVVRNVPMSTANAGTALYERALSLGLRVAEMSTTFDIDVESDLDSLRAELAPDGSRAPATWRVMYRLGLMPGAPDNIELAGTDSAA